MPTPRQSKTAVPIPGSISIEGPLPVTGRVQADIPAGLAVTAVRAPNKWEYLVAQPTNQEYQKWLNSLGTQGWEVVMPFSLLPGNNFVFKRPAGILAASASKPASSKKKKK